ncbi:unnamed protein product [Knipowitschia caucasica]
MASGAVLCAAALLNFAFVFITGSDFIRFVSFREIYHNITGETTRCQDSVAWSSALCDPRVLGSLLGDLCLVGLFALQHSVLAWTPVKQVCERSLGAMSRSVYCFTTALTLQVLMRCWQPVSGAPCLWSVRTAPWSVWFPLLCFSLHFVCWALICSILIIFDYPELMGIKQVYYKCIGRRDPPWDGASGAQRLLSHLRHPVCVELLLVLWVLPALTLDRLVLAAALSSYLLLGHSLDKQDLDHVCARFKPRVIKQQ